MLSIKRNNTAKTYQGTIDTMCPDPAAGFLQVSSASGATCLRGRQRLRPKDRRHRSTGALATVRCGIPPWLGICNSILPQLFQTNPYVQLIVQARVEIGNWSRKCCSLRCFQTQMCKCTLELKCNNSKWPQCHFLKTIFKIWNNQRPATLESKTVCFAADVPDGISQFCHSAKVVKIFYINPSVASWCRRNSIKNWGILDLIRNKHRGVFRKKQNCI